MSIIREHGKFIAVCDICFEQLSIEFRKGKCPRQASTTMDSFWRIWQTGQGLDMTLFSQCDIQTNNEHSRLVFCRVISHELGHP
jgi:hypothetical protein